ncbi:MAG: hypothetical protein AMJ88_11665 [Anaerolineae bacterium SM23_ 63]|nr:MAG: hypothetical protein AMJ88_11665 [Anaerolineae bacterium SM23_ 63]HEY46666.1 hypothetical protein [Anaerolineae bacterium]
MEGRKVGKTAFALITRRVDDAKTPIRFLTNARRYGHRIDRIIIAYSHGVDRGVVETLQRQVKVDLICAHGDDNLRQSLRALGLGSDAVDALLDVPSWSCHHEVPYGAYRNAILFNAILQGIDYLLFFDTDVKPWVLIGLDDGEPQWQEVDFVGIHLAHLAKPKVLATTSDYSGYYIIPPMAFDGLSELLIGLGKELSLDYVSLCDIHGCLNLGSHTPGPSVLTDKLLGGNLGLSLHQPWNLAPFFSTVYEFGDQCIKGRGEDTLLGQALVLNERQMVDVDLRIFHDTFDDFPTSPDIARKDVQTRFYNACLGWIGRNPFLTWFLSTMRRNEAHFKEEMKRQAESLSIGAVKAARFFENPQFERLPEALKVSMASLPESIERYQRLTRGWEKLINALTPDELPTETDEEMVDRPPMAA